MSSPTSPLWLYDGMDNLKEVAAALKWIQGMLDLKTFINRTMSYDERERAENLDNARRWGRIKVAEEDR